MTRSRLLAAALAAPLALGLLSGCGAAAEFAGIHQAPAEAESGAALSLTAANEILPRVLAAAGEARSNEGDDDARKATLTGPALREAEAAAKAGTRSKEVPDVEPQVLAVSRGTQWPRSILATARVGSTQHLYVLVSSEASDGFRVFADVPMAAGAEVPAVAPAAEGAPTSLTDEPEGKAAEVLGAWIKAVEFPAPTTKPDGISVMDDFSQALKTKAKTQDDDLGDLVSYRQQQELAEEPAITFELADGSTLGFASATRTDTFTAGSKLKELKIEDRVISRLVDSSTVTKKLTVTHAETLAVVLPPDGAAQVVGIGEQVEAASGS